MRAKMATAGLVLAVAIAATAIVASLSGSAKTIHLSLGSAQQQGCRQGEQAQPDGSCVYDPTKRSVCQVGDRIMPDGTCVHPDGGVTYQNVCNPGEQTLQNPLRCVYMPPSGPASCLSDERLLSNGSCGGTCPPGDHAQSDGSCVYDPTKRSVCKSGDRIMPDGTCVNPDGGVTYQNVCKPGEQTLQDPLRCVYKAASRERAPSGCLSGEQLLPDGTCGAMVSAGCNVGERILEVSGFEKVMCAYKVGSEEGCKPGACKVISEGLCIYTPAMVARSTGYRPYQPRLRP